MVNDLPGHQDEVYAVDWSPAGKMVGSGGKRQSYSDLELIDCNLIVPSSWLNAPKKLS